jgi:hypothetical protein
MVCSNTHVAGCITHSNLERRSVKRTLTFGSACFTCMTIQYTEFFLTCWRSHSCFSSHNKSNKRTYMCLSLIICSPKCFDGCRDHLQGNLRAWSRQPSKHFGERIISDKHILHMRICRSCYVNWNIIFNARNEHIHSLN